MDIMNTWTMDNLNSTDSESRIIAMIERIKSNAERKGVLDYAERELDRCETYAELKELNQTIWEYYPPSPKQIELANRLADELNMPHPTVNENHGMQWFSKWIGMAIEYSNKLPITDEQHDTLQAMQWCPDIPKLTDEDKQNRGTASAYIKAHNATFVLWKQTRLTPTTRRTLKELYRKVEQQNVTDNWLMQYDEKTALQMIAHLKQLQKELADFRAEKEIENDFRQFFINFDNEQRNEKAKARA